MRDIDNSENTLDSSDVIDRRDELREEREDLEAAIDDARECFLDCGQVHHAARADLLGAIDALADWYDENGGELAILEDFCSGFENYCGRNETLIRDSYFTTYAEELASEIGAYPATNNWPLTCIDWDRAASELQADYSSAEFDGVTYWYRE